MIFEARCTSIVTHFMSTVRADNFCPIDRTIWQCFESKFAVHKSFLHFLSLSLFIPPCFSQTPTLLLLLLIPFLILLPPSGSRLQVPLMAVNWTLRIHFFLNKTTKRSVNTTEVLIFLNCYCYIIINTKATPTNTDRGCKIQLMTLCSTITQRMPPLFFVLTFMCARTLLN